MFGWVEDSIYSLSLDAWQEKGVTGRQDVWTDDKHGGLDVETFRWSWHSCLTVCVSLCPD